MTLPTHIQGLVLKAVGQLELQSVPLPAMPPDWVLVRIGFCGVCGSDLPRIYSKGTYHFPTICGHEFAGTVVACGEQIKNIKPDQRVAVFPLIWCGKCDACEKGQYVQCHDYDYLGSRRDGGFAGYIAAPAKNLVPVPDAVSLEEAAMTEPAAVALHAVKRANTHYAGKTVAVFGAGPIGLMVAQWARIFGAAAIIVIDLIPEKLQMAQQLGFVHTCNSKEQDPVAFIEKLTGGQGAHISIDAAGVPITQRQAMQATRRGGHMVLLGNPAGDLTLAPALISQLLRREVTMYGTWNSDYSYTADDDDWRTSLSAMAAGTLQLKPLITHNVPLTKSIDTLNMMKEGKTFYSKVLIHPN